MTNWMDITNYFAGHWLETVGAITAVVGIWLTTRRSLACWPIILISDVACLIVVYRAHLKSDAWLQVFFIAFTLYGWWNWTRGVREEGEVRIARLPLPSLLADGCRRGRKSAPRCLYAAPRRRLSLYRCDLVYL